MNAAESQSTATPAVLGFGIAWALAYAAGALLIGEIALAPAVQTALALLPLPFFVAYLAALLRAVRRLDELHRRIQLEALAVGFPCTLVLAMTLGLLERTEVLQGISFKEDWFILVLPYFAGLALARRRYA